MSTPDPQLGPTSILASVDADLPPLERAVALAKRAAREGFDWRRTEDVVPVVRSEVEELAEAVERGSNRRVQDEFGDLLFALANLARHLGVDPAAALTGASRRFEARFARVEEQVRRSGRPMGEHTLEELDAMWGHAKAELAATEAACSCS